MRAEDLREVIRARPFRPFAIVAADGGRIRVDHPEWIMVRSERSAAVYDQDERLHIIDVMLIQRVEVEPPVPAGSPSPGPNGGE
ncbi:MAG: hypothetical protein ACP5XB_09610 [Isosphaeraceae bacterium]